MGVPKSLFSPSVCFREKQKMGHRDIILLAKFSFVIFAIYLSSVNCADAENNTVANVEILNLDSTANLINSIDRKVNEVQVSQGYRRHHHQGYTRGGPLHKSYVRKKTPQTGTNITVTSSGIPETIPERVSSSTLKYEFSSNQSTANFTSWKDYGVQDTSLGSGRGNGISQNNVEDDILKHNSIQTENSKKLEAIVPVHSKTHRFAEVVARSLAPFLSVISFWNDKCWTIGYEQGTCYSKKECTIRGGSPGGLCAAGFGVCCVFTYSCDTSTGLDRTYFVNPEYPHSVAKSGTTCDHTIRKLDGVCQLRLDFEEFQLERPGVDGTCWMDSLIIHGVEVKLPPLCGDLSGHHVYLPVGYVSEVKYTVTLSAEGPWRIWKIRTVKLKCNAAGLAPGGCLQFHQGTSGRLTSFNYVDTSPSNIQGLNYGICVRRSRGYCAIRWSKCGQANGKWRRRRDITANSKGDADKDENTETTKTVRSDKFTSYPQISVASGLKGATMDFEGKRNEMSNNVYKSAHPVSRARARGCFQTNGNFTSGISNSTSISCIITEVKGRSINHYKSPTNSNSWRPILPQPVQVEKESEPRSIASLRRKDEIPFFPQVFSQRRNTDRPRYKSTSSTVSRISNTSNSTSVSGKTVKKLKPIPSFPGKSIGSVVKPQLSYHSPKIGKIGKKPGSSSLTKGSSIFKPIKIGGGSKGLLGKPSKLKIKAKPIFGKNKLFKSKGSKPKAKPLKINKGNKRRKNKKRKNKGCGKVIPFPFPAVLPFPFGGGGGGGGGGGKDEDDDDYGSGWSSSGIISSVEPYLIRIVTDQHWDKELNSVCLDWEQIPCDEWHGGENFAVPPHIESHWEL